jgi:hypothetical protein
LIEEALSSRDCGSDDAGVDDGRSMLAAKTQLTITTSAIDMAIIFLFTTLS